MRHTKKLACSLLALTLASCGAGNSVVGRYKFQLGSDKGTHMGIFMDLTNEDVLNKSTSDVLGKKFELNVDMKGMTDDEGEIVDLLGSIDEDGDSAFKMSGYYNLGAGDYEGVLYLGTTLIEDFYDIDIDISPEIVERILYATIDYNTINVCIPVSINDLAFQLYWYGFRVDIQNFLSSELPIEILPEDRQHQIGTHPTEEDVADIRAYEVAKGLSENMFETYRDYHTLTMGLRR